MTGKLRSIRDDKDFAFIVAGVNRDIFLHRHEFHGNWEDLRTAWRLGPVELEFEIEEGPKGLRAIGCRLTEK